jgi:thiol-disulfide isomerase/thioredoxin
MKAILLFKSKMCGPCKMFEPQLKEVCETLNIDYIPVDVEENCIFKLWKDLTTQELINKFGISSSGKAVYLHTAETEGGPTIIYERPKRAADIINDNKMYD